MSEVPPVDVTSSRTNRDVKPKCKKNATLRLALGKLSTFRDIN
jgi:hypothetical protein